MGGAQTDAVTVNSIRAFLFDLDGTLVDSVPDLTTAVNQLRSAWRFEPVSEERVRCCPIRSKPYSIFSSRSGQWQVFEWQDFPDRVREWQDS